MKRNERSRVARPTGLTAKPPATTPEALVRLDVRVDDPTSASHLVATGARLGIDVVQQPLTAGRRVTIDPGETFAHALRVEALASLGDGSIDLIEPASPRARRALDGLVGSASSRSHAIVREEADGRLALVLRGHVPIDLGEPPEAERALRDARTRRIAEGAPDVVLPADAEERARAILFGPSRTLSDPSSRRVLEAFGIASSPWRLAENAARAAAHARAVGYPVDLRIASPDVSAIDDAQWSAIELRSPGEVREAFRTLSRLAKQASPDARLLGMTVTRSAPATPRLRLTLDRGSNTSRMDRLHVALDDDVGRTLTRKLIAPAPRDANDAVALLARFDGRAALPALESPRGRALLDLVVRFSRLGLVLTDTLVRAEVAPIAPIGDAGWGILGARVAVRGVDVATTDS